MWAHAAERYSCNMTREEGTMSVQGKGYQQRAFAHIHGAPGSRCLRVADAVAWNESELAPVLEEHVAWTHHGTHGTTRERESTC